MILATPCARVKEIEKAAFPSSLGKNLLAGDTTSPPQWGQSEGDMKPAGEKENG
jgi:hypothetical protein